MIASIHRRLCAGFVVGLATVACSVAISLPAKASLVMSCPGCAATTVGGTPVIASPTGLPPTIGLSRNPNVPLPLGQSNVTPLVLIPDNTPNGDKLNFNLAIRQGGATIGVATTAGCDLPCLAPTLGLAAEWSVAGSSFLTDYLKDSQPSGPSIAFDELLAATRAIDPGANGYFVYTPVAGVPIVFGTGSDAELSFDGLGGFPAGTVIEAFLIDLPSNSQFGGGISRDATAGALFVGAIPAVAEPPTLMLILASVGALVAQRGARRAGAGSKG
jgi:hypothetical protein